MLLSLELLIFNSIPFILHPSAFILFRPAQPKLLTPKVDSL